MMEELHMFWMFIYP